ncbi:MAG: OmpA family protein [Bacteroidales bacterium]|nr:OmpA family protein [Bacteroidales bacterium]MBN2820199.1 OmpA family protein [Bacteroidales bacterium]
MKQILLTAILFIAFSAKSYAQFPNFSREFRLLNQADKLYQERDYYKAVTKYREYISRYEGNVDVWYKIAISYKELGQPERSELYYSRIIKTDEQSNPIVHLSLGQVLMMQGKYKEAREHFQRYNELLEYNDQLAMRYISSIENIEKYFADSTFFDKQNLPINSEASDYGAATLDNNFYFLSTRDTRKDYNLKYSSDLFISEIEQGKSIFDSPKKLSGPANTRFGEIGYAIVPQTNEIYICRYEPGKEDDYSLGYNLYKAYIGVDNNISRPEKFRSDKFKYSIAYPTLSYDGKFLIFASDAPGGFGGWDLYRADFTSNGFDNIQNLGGKVNSAGQELYPFLLNDSILFYATDGQGGLGGYDVYSKNLNDEEYARNVGFPVNSNSDDYGIYFDSGLSGYFTSNRDGGKGADDIYRFSIDQLKLTGEVVDELNGENLKNVNIKINRSSGEAEALALADNGKLVLVARPGEELEITVEKEGYETRSFKVNTADMAYIGNHSLMIGKLPVLKLAEPESLAEKFEIAPEILEVAEQKDDIFFGVQFMVSKRRLKEDYLRSLVGQNYEISEVYDGKNYRYLVGQNKDYFLTKEDYKKLEIDSKVYLVSFVNNEFTRVMKALKMAHVDPAEARDPIVHEFIDKTKQVGFGLVFYGLDLFRVPAGYEKEINRIKDTLVAHPEYFLEIAAHTDKRGSDMYNRALSEERAKFLFNLFVSMGIEENRIIAHGIGESQLKKYCQECTEADHEQNRRAEMIIRVYKDPNQAPKE